MIDLEKFIIELIISLEYSKSDYCWLPQKFERNEKFKDRNIDMQKVDQIVTTNHSRDSKSF